MIPIFWTREYAAMHGEKHQLLEFSFEGKDVIFPFTRDGASIKSPGLGTFGGLFSLNGISDWSKCFRDMLSYLGDHKDVTIRFPPSYFRDDIFKSQYEALSSNFEAEHLIDLNQHVEIGPAAEELLSKGNRKKNRQFSENMGTVVVNSLDDFEEIVSVLQKSRERHNVTLSMSRNQILNALQAMPNAYTTYAAKIGHEVIAAAITVQIDTQTVYVLYWGDDNGSWKNLSPTVAIFMRIYNESLLRGIKVLDLGTSSVNAQVNEGLRRFKNNLGAVESKRITSKFKI